ncbi:hypothetical protein [Haloechinothrix salitolerans]|uniref:Secreted protein n=1 Tax=Haloechinothrix salitolerans TaxID=926830 RepID=A0ABW2C214_9PSEU
MSYLVKLGVAAGAAIAFGVLQAPAALALPTEPVLRYCEWNGKYYKPGEEIEVYSPDGTLRTYRCDPDGTGEWEEVSYTYSHSYGYTAYWW